MFSYFLKEWCRVGGSDATLHFTATVAVVRGDKTTRNKWKALLLPSVTGMAVLIRRV